MLCHNWLHRFDSQFFNFSTQQLALAVRYANILQLLIARQEEFQQLVRHIDISISAFSTVLFERWLTPGEGVFVDLWNRGNS